MASRVAEHASGWPASARGDSSSGTTQTVNDVMIGDVWLCSGQSNMQLQVERALDSWSEIRNSANDSIRIMTVPLASNALPQETFGSPVQWAKASPTTVPGFSAVCFYLARELQKQDNVPMGLIASAWGGSKIQSWMSMSALRATGAYDRSLDVLKLSSSDPAAAGANGARFGNRGGVSVRMLAVAPSPGAPSPPALGMLLRSNVARGSSGEFRSSPVTTAHCGIARP